MDEKTTVEKLKKKISRLQVQVAQLTQREKQHARIEATVQEHERIFQALMEYIPEGICLFDVREEAFRLCSREAMLIAGQSPEEAHRLHEAGDPTSFLAQTPVYRPDGTPLEVAEMPLARAVEYGEVVKNEEVLLQRPDGSRVPLLCNAAPIYDEKGNITGGILVYRDITERKQAEKALRALNETLERRIEHRTAALRKSREQFRRLSSELLQAQENERKRIAKEVHDSAAQVLSAVKYRMESILLHAHKGGTKALIEPIKALIPLIQHSIEDMRRLQMELRPSILDEMGLLATLAWYVREFEATYPSVRVDQAIGVKEQDIPGSLKLVIFRIVQEALTNAGKHSDADVVRITVQKSANAFVLTIEDNGRGFEVEDAQQIKEFGQGLGLSSMRERAQYSGGTLTIKSAPGDGTRIEAQWPKTGLM